MAMADGGELIVMAPGVTKFGEDPGIDSLIRQVCLVRVLSSAMFVQVPSSLYVYRLQHTAFFVRLPTAVVTSFVTRDSFMKNAFEAVVGCPLPY